MEEKIREYNKWFCNYNISDLPIGLFDGKMGICIYWYIQARCYNKELYESKASNLLDEIFKDLERKTCPCEFENGIIGIAFAIDYLLENGFVTGDRNEVLEDVDDMIFRNLYYEHINTTSKSKRAIVDSDELWSGIYFAKRLQHGNLSKDKEFMYKRIVMEVLNRTSSLVNTLINSEPIIFAPFSYLYLILLCFLTEAAKCHFYNNKIKLLIEEWKDDIKSIIPNSEGHKYIMWGFLSQLTQILHTNSLQQYLNMIKNYTDIVSFTKEELHSRDVILGGGISTWVLYLLQNNELDADTCNIANKRIEESILWRDWKKNKEKNKYPEALGDNDIQVFDNDKTPEKEQLSYKFRVGLFTSLTGSIATYQIINDLWKK